MCMNPCNKVSPISTDHLTRVTRPFPDPMSKKRSGRRDYVQLPSLGSQPYRVLLLCMLNPIAICLHA